MRNLLWKKDVKKVRASLLWERRFSSVSVLIHGQLHFWCTLRLKTCGVRDGTLLVSMRVERLFHGWCDGTVHCEQRWLHSCPRLSALSLGNPVTWESFALSLTNLLGSFLHTCGQSCYHFSFHSHLVRFFSK